MTTSAKTQPPPQSLFARRGKDFDDLHAHVSFEPSQRMREREQEREREKTPTSAQIRDVAQQLALQRVSTQSFISLPPQLHILVVDDSFSNRKLLQRLLTREGHCVAEADDGEVAVALVLDAMRATAAEECTPPSRSALMDPAPAPRVFDLILMDFFMERMNGPDAVLLIRDAGFKGRVIGVTGLMDEDCQQFIESGADAVLCKPITVPAIWKTLQLIETGSSKLME